MTATTATRKEVPRNRLLVSVFTLPHLKLEWNLKMNLKEAYPGKYLRHAELKGHDVRVEMDFVECEEMKDFDSNKMVEKPVLYFKNRRRGVVLNKTNWRTIAKAFGDESDGWGGRDIVLFPTTTPVAGEEKACLRVRAPKDDQDGMSDDIPF